MTPSARTSGVDASLRLVYATQWVPMVRLAALMLGSTSAAEEIVQEAFVKLYARWSRLRDPSTAVGYLRVSVVNGCRSWHRHQAVERRHRPLPPPDPGGPEEVAEQHELDRSVLRALANLPPRQREVLVLRYYADATEAEIADLCRISRGAVKSHAHRGLAALRRALQPEVTT